METKAFEVRSISGSSGAEILGIDLAAEPGHNVVAAIREAWLEHGVIFFRDQELPPAKFLAFAKRFGDVVEYPFVSGIEGFPEIIAVTKLEHEKHNFGGVWHTDTAYLETPPMGTMLIAREVPPRGGDTMFANMYLAYETLSHGMKRLLDGLVAINSSAKADVSRTREDRVRDSARADAPKEYIGEHPVVRTHPETGRKTLYVNVAHTVRFRDMTEEESAPILEFLFRHQTRPEFTCRFHWQAGSLAFLGQSLRPAQSNQRLPRLSPRHASGDARRGQAALEDLRSQSTPASAITAPPRAPARRVAPNNSRMRCG